MTDQRETVQRWPHQLHGSLVILKKNARLYYLKPPVLIFGVLFPVFFFLAFKMGRPIATGNIVPGMVAMALWFTSSAVGPLVTPWERSGKTYERLISTPVALPAILAGDVISGFIFGACFSAIPVLLGLVLTDASVRNMSLLIAGIIISALSFASLGVLLSSFPARTPSNTMLLSNLVRLPLLFVSGIFIPIAKMPVWARWLAPISPLSYASSLIRSGFGQSAYFPVWLNFFMLVLFTVTMFLAACKFHNIWRGKGL
ncbi:ABC transporter, membrane protein [Syntrophotalea carbinolica DSM 2380]|uniref:Transport permease protein n=1 Tax=Syntrophotalea carbinolica (strain DSM 2380 / NBRC 103641 / GraBd1) TaxID=338963 RepID=Q3A487_SYNC1|nr:ABC transporter permease [Syntrophotalea carbinolica]ABA88820.1 ABC transporter, membrane protein [Syntrophotalea carbinolica DSM 2380]